MAARGSETFWCSVLSLAYNNSSDEGSDRTLSPHRLLSLVQGPDETFVTDSTYNGTWIPELRSMTGIGTYTYPTGVTYHGRFHEGHLRSGIFYYPMRQKVSKEDRSLTATFADGLIYSDPFLYCTPVDRRYLISIRDGFMPPGLERLTNSTTDRPIPKGCYDTGDGFYNPELKCVVSANDTNVILRIPSTQEEKWIRDNCRKAWDEPVGYAPHLYEKWTTGIKEDLDDPEDRVFISHGEE